LFSSLTPTAIDYNPNVSATMQQPSSVVHANYKTTRGHQCVFNDDYVLQTFMLTLYYHNLLCKALLLIVYLGHIVM